MCLAFLLNMRQNSIFRLRINYESPGLVTPVLQARLQENQCIHDSERSSYSLKTLKSQ
jgi:hypothetical protein